MKTEGAMNANAATSTDRAVNTNAATSTDRAMNTDRATNNEGATMKTAVVCFSQTGNTAKVAAAIAEAIEEVTGDVVLVESIHADGSVAPGAASAALEDHGLVFVGMPIVQFGAPEAARRFLEEQCAGRRVALFVTHAAPVDMPELDPWLEACKDAASGTRLEGFFNCQGQLAEPVRQYMLASETPDLVRFAGMAACAEGQPDEAALTRAAAFARDVAVRTHMVLRSGGPTGGGLNRVGRRRSEYPRRSAGRSRRTPL